MAAASALANVNRLVATNSYFSSVASRPVAAMMRGGPGSAPSG
ncbi:hypothetical protein AHiyo6_35060, partial [Arthrobacter sp. Hiyo6]